MEHDEHEMLIEYSEMTAFNFNSKEFQEIKKDYVECKDVVSHITGALQGIVEFLKPAKNY